MPPNVTDVEEYYKKFEGFEDFVEEGSQKEYRKAQREKKMSSWRRGNNVLTFSVGTPVPAVPRGSQSRSSATPVDHPSAISPALAEYRLNMATKRAAESSSSSPGIYPKKRRKYESETPPVAGPSTGPNRVRTPQTGIPSKKRPNDREVINLISDDEDEIVIVSPPLKKQKTATPIPQVPYVRKQRKALIIDPRAIDLTDSEGDDVEIIREQLYPSPVPVHEVPQVAEAEHDYRQDAPEDSDDEWLHPGYDLDAERSWLPFDQHIKKMEPPLTEQLDNLSIDTPQLPLPLPPPRSDTSRWGPPPPPKVLRLADNLRFRRRPLPAAAQFSRRLITRPYETDINLFNLTVTQSLKKAPGPIGKIEQKDGWTIFASACSGGLADVPNEIPDAYNKAGALMSLDANNRDDIPANGHEVKKVRPGAEWTKYYTVNDIKFDPTSLAFISSGEDKALRLWTPGPHPDPDKPLQEAWIPFAFERLYNTPHDIAFRPGSGVFAVAEKQVRLFNLSDRVIEQMSTFNMLDRNTRHVIGSMAWGVQSSANRLFVSSEPIDPTFTGHHKVYDSQSQKLLYQFDATEAGDGITVDSEGSTVALCTQAAANHHILRLYDVRGQDPMATATINLEPFPDRENYEGEVNAVSFSPDGIYLALARNDNHTHVYDRRMLVNGRGRGPVFDYEHWGKSQVSADRYGVVNAQWVQSAMTRRMALVTGGEDGCIRLWDPLKAADSPENGAVLAKVNSDISQFSLGDPFAGADQLVVGDSTGEATIFNRVVC